MPRHNVDVPRQSPKREPATAARQKLREFSGSLPESYEDFPWGELVMKVNKKVFVFLGAEPGSPDAPARPGMSVKLDDYREAALAVDGAEPCRLTSRRFLRAATPGQQAAPAWPCWPAECNGRPWMSRLPVSRCRGRSRWPLTDRRCTCGGPFLHLAGRHR